jgi:LemA protein
MEIAKHLRAGRVLLISAIAIVALTGTCTVRTYNRLTRADQNAQAQWAQVENTYQRRNDLIPNLIETVKGAAAFERGTLEAVTAARSRMGQINVPADITSKPELMEKYQAAQDQLGATLSRLLVVSESYPTLTATANFRDLQAQLEGTENRITVERMRFNEAARNFNSLAASFPTSVVAGLFSNRFQQKVYFQATAASAEPPKVNF